jgi:hypothetical protein
MCWINREDEKTNEEINVKPDYPFSSIEGPGDNLSVMLLSRHYQIRIKRSLIKLP